MKYSHISFEIKIEKEIWTILTILISVKFARERLIYDEPQRKDMNIE